MGNTDWIDEETGYHCRMWDGGRHLCGYVAVPETHPFYGKDYNHEVPMPQGLMEQPVGKRGALNVITMSLAADRGMARISDIIDVHGSLTFGDAIKGAPARWYFGFDCAHAGDNRETCNEDYVKAEIKSLAKQLDALH